MFSIESIAPLMMPGRAKRVADTIKRTVGFIGVSDTVDGTLLIYNNLDNAITAWHKMSDATYVANDIMEGTMDGDTLTVGKVAKQMRLN